MVSLHATSDSLGNFGDGGALRVLRSNLTIEHSVFAHNRADGGGAVKASGTIRIFNTLFKNNTVRNTIGSCVGVAVAVMRTVDCKQFVQALDSGGAIYATGLLGSSLQQLQGARVTHDSIGSSIVLNGCAFLNNTAANYGGGLYVKNDQVLERFDHWVVR